MEDSNDKESISDNICNDDIEKYFKENNIPYAEMPDSNKDKTDYIPKPQMSCVIEEKDIQIDKLRLGNEIKGNPRMYTDCKVEKLKEAYVGEIVDLYVIPYDKNLDYYFIISGNRRYLAFKDKNVSLRCKIFDGYGENREDVLKAMNYVRWLEKEQKRHSDLACWIYYLNLFKEGKTLKDIYEKYNWGHTSESIRVYLVWAKKLDDVKYGGKSALEILNEKNFGIKKAIEFSKMDSYELEKLLWSITNDYVKSGGKKSDMKKETLKICVTVSKDKYDKVKSTDYEIRLNQIAERMLGMFCSIQDKNKVMVKKDVLECIELFNEIVLKAGM